MEEYRLYDAEYRFMRLIWEHEPVNSTQLVKLCAQAFGWKKSTTYTMIKRLADRKIVKNEDATVTSLIKLDQVQRNESNAILDKVFEGSLPTFITAFLSDKTLSQEEADRIIKMIREATE